MPFVNATVRRIEVHAAGEGEAEWRLNIRGKAAAGGSGEYEAAWHADEVSDGNHYPIGPGRFNVYIFGKRDLLMLHMAFKANRNRAEVARSSKESCCPIMAVRFV